MCVLLLPEAHGRGVSQGLTLAEGILESGLGHLMGGPRPPITVAKGFTSSTASAPSPEGRDSGWAGPAADAGPLSPVTGVSH